LPPRSVAVWDEWGGDEIAGPWFKVAKNAIWVNLAPSWGSFDTTGADSGLDLSDAAGAGPENPNWGQTEVAAATPPAHGVGVPDSTHGGPATSPAPMSICATGGLAVRLKGVHLKALDMWHLGKINWSNTSSGGPQKRQEAAIGPGGPWWKTGFDEAV